MRGHRFPIIAVFVTLLLSARPGGAVEFAGGTGEPNDPYQIATAEQLIALASARWSGATRGGGTAPDTGLTSRHFALVADIDLDPCLPGGRGFSEPLLALTSGSLDGRGHKVLNLHVAPWGRHSGMNLGSDVVVRDIHFERVVVEGDSPILASANEGYIINCSVEGAACGVGLVAENRGVVMGCSVTAQAGGVCGLAGVNSGRILFSHVAGGLAADGGLVRENSGTISDCYCTADVVGGRTAGGLVGTNSGDILRCYATGAVSVSAASGASSSSAGGLVGTNLGVVTDCYALGSSTAAGTGPYYTYVGGLVGANNGTVLRCYATGSGGDGLTGGFYASGLVVNSYFLSPNDGGGRINGPGVPLTDLQMGRRESFVGWDFRGSDLDGTQETWDMPEKGGYPILAAVQRLETAGSGNAEDPYLIESADQFLAICYDAAAYYRLAADIDLGGRAFSHCLIPTFYGHLDGDDHSLSNFTFTGEEESAVFGLVQKGATITNLNLHNIDVMPARLKLPPLAGVLAMRNGGRIVGCSVSAETAMWGPVSGSVPGEAVGGLVAVNEEGGQISRCFVSWVAVGAANRGGQAYWGGIAGHNAGRIAECHVSVLVSGYIARCGSLVGRNDGAVTDCYADGYCLVAGLVHSNAGRIESCYAAVQVPSGTARAGLVADNAPLDPRSSTETTEGTIADSYFLAEADGGGPDNGLGTVLSDAQMRSQASFVGWDFESVWTICEGRDYPRLRWEEPACEP